MLRERLLVSCVLIPSLVGLFAWDHSLGGEAPVLLVLVGLLAVRLAFELVQLLHRRDLKASWPLSGIAVAVLVVAGWSPQLWGRVCECLADGRPLERVALTLAVVMLVLFIGLCAWPFRPGAKKRNRDAANLIFEGQADGE